MKLSRPPIPQYSYKGTARRKKLDLSSGTDTVKLKGDQYVEPNYYIDSNKDRDNGLYAVGTAVLPSKVAISSSKPADFDSFSGEKLALKAKILDALGSKAHGCLAKPGREGKFPAGIQLQYAGGAGYPDWPSDNPEVMLDTISPPAGAWTVLNQIPRAKEPLLTPQKERGCPARGREILDTLVKGDAFQPSGAER